ncbi:hypothetical protein CXG81DRAFT_17909 [Caulochytrium protostelioides]|uniref:Uncharacterized protein n=1 Tax=Caulochytrium protostelioides TaxID=1555241 RepID=A0A4P9XAR5_9FUNG|nr:hypothetical protein CXG81DRAFT_17909 [Caulochytrium protostelioides]|eukprot:RKP02467.1 hypothetical protein CXG81DRAFT_17909 [Caulochytrium protostelioides]
MPTFARSGVMTAAPLPPSLVNGPPRHSSCTFPSITEVYYAVDSPLPTPHPVSQSLHLSIFLSACDFALSFSAATAAFVMFTMLSLGRSLAIMAAMIASIAMWTSASPFPTDPQAIDEWHQKVASSAFTSQIAEQALAEVLPKDRDSSSNTAKRKAEDAADQSSDRRPPPTPTKTFYDPVRAMVVNSFEPKDREMIDVSSSSGASMPGPIGVVTEEGRHGSRDNGPAFTDLLALVNGHRLRYQEAIAKAKSIRAVLEPYSLSVEELHGYLNELTNTGRRSRTTALTQVLPYFQLTYRHKSHYPPIETSEGLPKKNKQRKEGKASLKNPTRLPVRLIPKSDLFARPLKEYTDALATKKQLEASKAHREAVKSSQETNANFEKQLVTLNQSIDRSARAIEHLVDEATIAYKGIERVYLNHEVGTSVLIAHTKFKKWIAASLKAAARREFMLDQCLAKTTYISSVLSSLEPPNKGKVQGALVK